MLRKATDRPIDYKIENEITDKEEKYERVFTNKYYRIRKLHIKTP